MSKATVVFIHGNSLSAQTFSNQLNAFPDIVSLAIDLPGHGALNNHPLSPELSSIKGYAEFLVQSIKKQVSGDFVLAGHSLGGHAAIEAMPELINNGLKGLFIFGTPPVTKPANIEEAFMPWPLMPLLFKHDLSAEEMQQLASSFVKNQDYTHSLAQSISMSNPDFRRYFAESFAMGLYENERELIENMDIPVAVVHGEHDPVINLEYLKSLKWKNLWDSEIKVMEGVGHSPFLEDSATFNKILSDFCKDVLTR